LSKVSPRIGEVPSILNLIKRKTARVVIYFFCKIIKNEKFQHVILISPYPYFRIHKGNFGQSYEKYWKLDLNRGADKNTTRLRNYFNCNFAQIASRGTNEVRFLFCGVRNGVSAKVVASYMKNLNYNMKFILIDPFDGRDDTEAVSLSGCQKDWDSSINSEWIVDTIPDALKKNRIKIVNAIFLNTTQFEAELESLPYLFDSLAKGGVLIMDIYGFIPEVSQKAVDALIDKYNFISFMLPSLQLIVMNPFS